MARIPKLRNFDGNLTIRAEQTSREGHVSYFMVEIKGSKVRSLNLNKLAGTIAEGVYKRFRLLQKGGNKQLKSNLPISFKVRTEDMLIADSTWLSAEVGEENIRPTSQAALGLHIYAAMVLVNYKPVMRELTDFTKNEANQKFIEDNDMNLWEAGEETEETETEAELN